MTGKRTTRPGRAKKRGRFLRAFAWLAAAVAVVGVVVLLLVYRSSTPQPRPPQPTVVFAPGPVEPAPRPVAVVTFADGCLTSECHSSMGQRAFVHQTVAEHACDLCHQPDVGGHVFPQLASNESTCTSCHDTGADHAFQHQAMEEKSCLACHDPHGSESPMLLTLGTVETTCALCHPSDQGSVAHQPYNAGECGECHEPHGASNAMLLVNGATPNLCAKCHTPLIDAMNAGSHTHLAVEGSCMGCHEAHAGSQASLLTDSTRNLCVSCHEEVGHTVAGATVSHDSVLKGDQCLTCHDPHTSEQPAMLRDTQARVCLSCHDQPVTASDGREVMAVGPAMHEASLVHGAVTIGLCSDCHSVHGGTHSRLLNELNPSVFTGPFDVRNYALCFSCHDESLVEPTGVTSFRDGEQNLHSTHLRAHDKSGGCSDCHAVHAGNQPRLIVDAVRYQGSDWSMPMNFKMTATGGSCAPGCHTPLEYDRRAGGINAQRDGEEP